MTTKADQLLRISTFNHVGMHIQEELDVEGIYRLIGEGLKEIGLNCVILLLDEKEENLRLAYTSVAPSLVSKTEKILRIKVKDFQITVDGEVPVTKAFKEKKPVYIEKASDILAKMKQPFPSPIINQVAKLLGMGRAISVPLVARRKTFGVLNVFTRDLDEAETPTIVAFANQLAIAIDNTVRLPREFEAKNKEIADSEKKFRQLLEDINDGYIVYQDTGIVYANQRFAEIFGYTVDEVLGNDLFTFVNPDSFELVMKEYSRIICSEEETPERHEIAAIKKNGTEFIVDIGLKHINYEDKPAFSALIRDITDRKKAEEALLASEREVRQLNNELEQRVIERTAQLEAANKELEAFSYSVSHDLRAPLRSIDGFSQVILEDYADKLDEEGEDYLRRLRAASQRMGYLIDDMLKLSRVTRSNMQRINVNLSALAESIANELRQYDPDRKVDVVIAKDLQAIGDEQLLEAALENLLNNAWKFTGKKEQAKIEFGYEQTNGTGVYFVRDDGVGFDMTYSDKLFGAFQRLHPPSEFEGTGIGLATVQRIVNRHGGKVWAEGAVDQGATFYFTLE